MRLLPIVLGALIVTGCSGKREMADAEGAVARFHAAYNKGDFDAIAGEAASNMQSEAVARELPELLAAMSERLGPYDYGARSNVNVRFSASGTQVRIAYHSRYRGGPAQENFVFAKQDKVMRLAGYTVNAGAVLSR